MKKKRSEDLPPPFGPMMAVREVNGPTRCSPRNDLKLQTWIEINLLFKEKAEVRQIAGETWSRVTY